MEKVKLADIAEFIRTGKTPPTSQNKYFDGEVNWYTPGDFRNGKNLSKSKRTLTELSFIEKKAVVFPKNTLLITCIGDIGKLGITYEESSSNQQITGLKPNKNIDVDYLYYWFLLNKKKIESTANNAVVAILNNKTLQNIEFEYPPLPTQQKIAGILDKADELRQYNRQLIEKYDALTQSLFLEMFGDPVHNSKKWEITQFSEVGKLDRGKSKHRPRNAPELLNGPYPLIQTGDVARSGGYITRFKSTYSEFGLKQSKLWPKETLCITIAANIAQTGILTFEACFPDSVVGFVPNVKTNNIYVQNWMSFLQVMIEEKAPMAAQKNINLAILKQLDFMLPPITLQNQFAERVQAIEAQKQQAQEALEKSEQLFQGLLQQAFKGELN
jgi:type I restriction enzyme S subunit